MTVFFFLPFSHLPLILKVFSILPSKGGPSHKPWPTFSLVVSNKSPPPPPPPAFKFLNMPLSKLLLMFTELFYTPYMKVKVLVAQSCPTLCDPMDYRPPGSSVHGILQARVLEWVAFPSPGDLPNLGIEPRSPALQADSFPSEPLGKPYIPYIILGIWTSSFM